MLCVKITPWSCFFFTKIISSWSINSSLQHTYHWSQILLHIARVFRWFKRYYHLRLTFVLIFFGPTISIYLFLLLCSPSNLIQELIGSLSSMEDLKKSYFRFNLIWFFEPWCILFLILYNSITLIFTTRLVKELFSIRFNPRSETQCILFLKL